MADLLGVHVIGSGLGESIVLELPGGKVGVIDCFCRRLQTQTPEERLDSNPTLRFLVERLHAKSLAFLAFTHPHEDHGRGMSQILQHYHGQIDEVWVFDPYQETALAKHFELLLKHKIRLPIEKVLDLKPGEFSVELLKIRNLIRDELKTPRPHPVELRKFQGFQEFQIEGESLAIFFLGPDAAIVDDYQAQLVTGLGSVVDTETTEVDATWKPTDVKHNWVSPAILLVYGQTTVLLGGDMESRAWMKVMDEQVSATLKRPRLKCNLVKVSHHGSASGYCEGLYDAIAGKPRAVAILTPFTRHAHPLPQKDGIEHVVKYVDELLATNREQAAKSSGVDSKLADRCLGSDWVSMLVEHPDWAGVIDPSLFEDATAPAEFIPLELVEYLERQPQLAEALRPELLTQMFPKPDDRLAERDCLISIYFDADGNEHKKKRIIGRRAGHLFPPRSRQ